MRGRWTTGRIWSSIRPGVASRRLERHREAKWRGGSEPRCHGRRIGWRGRRRHARSEEVVAPASRLPQEVAARGGRRTGRGTTCASGTECSAPAIPRRWRSPHNAPNTGARRATGSDWSRVPVRAPEMGGATGLPHGGRRRLGHAGRWTQGSRRNMRFRAPRAPEWGRRERRGPREYVAWSRDACAGGARGGPVHGREGGDVTGACRANSRAKTAREGRSHAARWGDGMESGRKDRG